ncbi:NADPH-dependent assimilatory sulfite reductase hemoprotein subunit [Arenibaculum pallidiluteum]|uniref:NADPH-dependent assimilatory sulfite reductase hemoprotein subunit n=1 Tax=Arenibaculum pallidiluteum TaxID=2812559 RepID=UPI001A95EA48|nr:NADPH-dependent assimilatory sulfite reductase hemoprotein subunit [Arenibaculum pallidiluteum]
MADEPTARSKNEILKENSRYLRGTIAEGLQEVVTGALSDDDTLLTKFHGFYQQDDRDIRSERRKKKLEKAYSFMIRVRVPGGVATPAQWLEMDRISDQFANGTLKLTTRQAFQFHGVIKTNLKRVMKEINASLLDTLAACGDVNRNVMCNPNPHQSRAHAEALRLAREISDHLSPRTGAYHEIWIEDEKVYDGEQAATEEEPIYGKHYLPRKFKIVVAVPPSNDVDVFAHDLAFVAIVEDGTVVGYDVTVGGGMGMTHGEEDTFPRTADILGFCTPEQAVDVAEKVLLVQRDFGDRAVRKHARLKYTIERRGIAWFRDEVEKRLGYSLGAPRPFAFDGTGDRYGWVEDHEGNFHYTAFIQNGRVRDVPGHTAKTALREIARIHDGDFRLTANQNLIIARVRPENRVAVEAILKAHGLDNAHTGLRLNSMACVALPTCGLALAESERFLPDLVSELDAVVERAGLRDDEIVIRMTGCPNGCARPYLAEIGLVGRGPGVYNLYLGAAFDGSRLNKLYRRDLKAEEIAPVLTPLIRSYAKQRRKGERFGDYVIRAGHVAATTAGNRFHADLGADVDAGATAGGARG